MAKNKETSDQIISVRLTGFEVTILERLGGPSEFLRSQIQEKAGDKFKLLQLKQQTLDRIDVDQKRVKDIDKLIIEMEEKIAEDLKLKKEQEKARPDSVKPKQSLTVINKEKWLISVKPTLLKHLQDGGISQGNYETVRLYKGFKTNEEVDAWVREPIIEEPKNMLVKQKMEQLL